ncbi:hypothetical protein AQUCO_04300001v1 [Aquilegia coerulea]|uniref:F-box associated beta-propeller type 3 domain-containing protein n=1 Tax=Aquilegia coerulea TaxID=218851 RepID=A0A2G5CN98_AQUCA|nr:hypothetical protein AQUCO_04300001v1 [Aquilegia coerulea]PIA32757.1 hypothetical protein AQUCO_04300001v1 [Aquilegia coerulea]
MRFRCVCKAWYNLLSSDLSFIRMSLCRAMERGDLNLLACKFETHLKEIEFIQLYAVANEKGIGFFSELDIYCVDSYSFDVAVKLKNPFGKSFFHESHLLGSCNGIVCLIRKNVVCLWNPCTTEYKIVNFEINSKVEDAIWGFGYDASKDDYILMRFVNSDDYDSKIFVYLLNDATWMAAVNIPFKILSDKELGIFINGSFHWVGKSDDENPKMILSFNLGDKSFRQIPVPDGVHSNADITVGELKGQLCILCKDYTKTNTDIEIWMMRIYGKKKSWSKMIAIEESVYSSWPYDFASKQKLHLRPLCYVNTEEILLKDEKNLFLYDPTLKTARNLETHGISDWSKINRIVTHVSSLVPLKSGTYLRTSPGVEGEEKARVRGPDSMIIGKILADVFESHS